MPGVATRVMGNTTTATQTALSCTGGRDVFYSFTLAQREIVSIDTFGSAFDTVIGFATSCAVTPTMCTDDSCSTLQSQVPTVLDAGTYYIVVDGFGTSSGAFTLNVEHLPVNGAPSGALFAGMQTLNGSTVASANSPGTCGTAPDRWYYWLTCPAAPGGTFTATTCVPGSGNYDTTLQLRNGSGAGGGCNDDACGLLSTLSAMVPAGGGLHVFYADGAGASTGMYSAVVNRP